ncbi:MAG: hypothetical protein ACR2IK_05715 [Chloroflexota bacterium]
MDPSLTEILTAVLAHNRSLIDRTGQRWPDRPVVATLSWMPKMNKCDLVLTSIDRAPPFHPQRSLPRP